MPSEGLPWLTYRYRPPFSQHHRLALRLSHNQTFPSSKLKPTERKRRKNVPSFQGIKGFMSRPAEREAEAAAFPEMQCRQAGRQAVIMRASLFGDDVVPVSTILSFLCNHPVLLFWSTILQRLA